MHKTLAACTGFIKRETVLCAALLLALVSVFLVPPDAAYAGYVDWDTLTLLFSLMAVMQGFSGGGLFVFLGERLLIKTRTSSQMLFALVFLPFFFSTVITNDVALITFVPFGIAVLKMSGQERLAVPVIALQTVAANMGSSLTPMGNPQNLYLYSKFSVGFSELILLMLPYVVISGVCTALLVLLRRSAPVVPPAPSATVLSKKRCLISTVGFAVCLLALFGIIPPAAVAAFILVFLIAADRRLLAKIDYSLLATFAAFFVFIGNIGRIEQFRAFISSAIEGRVVPVSALASQIVSNVPAALLLSGFSDDWRGLIAGCNIGGLGTLIASMASLISYKFLAKEFPEQRGRYLIYFTLCNIGLLALLLAVSFIL